MASFLRRVAVLIQPDQTMQLSVVIPFHRDVLNLQRCLAAIRAAARALPSAIALRETIVVADGAVDDPAPTARVLGARVVTLDRSYGPATARNRGAAACLGDVIVFIDSDVVVSRRALAQIASRLTSDADLQAVFGAYDESPADPGFISQGKNLAHSFIHQRSFGEVRTFWAGLGAVRRRAFARVGGFDERFARPSIEDIDLGYRITAAGGRILLDASIQGQHLKRWTLRQAIVSDIRDRGVPWTQLVYRYGGRNDDLNLSMAHRVSVFVAYLSLAALAASPWWPRVLVVVPCGLIALVLLDWAYLSFLANRRSMRFATAWFSIRALHHLCNGLSFVAGTILYACRRWLRLPLPGALPVTAWVRIDAPAAPDEAPAKRRASLPLEKATSNRLAPSR